MKRYIFIFATLFSALLMAAQTDRPSSIDKSIALGLD